MSLHSQFLQYIVFIYSFKKTIKKSLNWQSVENKSTAVLD